MYSPVVTPMLCWFIVGCYSHQDNAMMTDSASSNTAQQRQEVGEDQTNHLQLMQQWTRMFFSMSRVPRKGSQMLIFPGLGEEFPQPSSDLLVASALTAEEPHLMVTTDSRLYSHYEPYSFADVESVDEDQRQRRRVRSARKQLNLLEANEEHVTTMINTVMSSPRDFLANHSVRASVVHYLTAKMRSFGLVTGNQVFDPLEFAELFDGNVTNGTNVIGILPGELWGTKDDEVLVLGAHWDTVPSSAGMDDNGSGVTAVLEVARAMTEASCRPRHSVIFVAFDMEEVGCLGSIFFVRDFLIPRVLQAHGGARLKGAYILDTIMNYNETQFSQTLSPEWQKALPEFWTDLKGENQTGNFLAVLYRRDADSPLANSFAAHWREEDGRKIVSSRFVNRPPSNAPKRFRVGNREITISQADADSAVETVKANKSKFRMKKIRMELEAEVGDQLEKLTDWIDLLRSDHSRFWYHHVEGYPHTLPAVLITDTAPYRGVMQECYHQQCDSSSANKQLKFANIKFLTKTCQALIDSVVSLSEAKCLSDDHPLHRRDPAGVVSGSSALAALPSVLLAAIYVVCFHCQQFL